MTEHDEQVYLFQWLDVAGSQCPDLHLVFAIPNGGKRDIHTAKNMKQEGVRAGVPDIFIPCPRGQYHGLFIELKTSQGKATTQQKAWIKALNAQGYRAVVCKGWIEAMNEIERYLEGQ